MKRNIFAVVFLMFLSGCVLSPTKPLMLDDFEGKINQNTVDFGAGNNSQIDVTVSTDIVNTGKQSLKVAYETVPSGYMWVARGYELDVKGADKWSMAPQKIRWQGYQGFSFYIYSAKKGVMIAFDVKDKDKEMWRKVFTVKKEGWQEIIVPFGELFARTDWQPENAELNGQIDYPIKSYQFEVRTPGEGVIYIDTVKLFTGKE